MGSSICIFLPYSKKKREILKYHFSTILEAPNADITGSALAETSVECALVIHLIIFLRHNLFRLGLSSDVADVPQLRLLLLLL